MNRAHAINRWHASRNGNAMHGSQVRRMKFEPLLEYLQGRQHALPEFWREQYEYLQHIKLADSIALEHYLTLFKEAALALGDGCLGARIGLNSHSPSLLPLLELFVNAPTLHDALLELNRGTPALQDSTRTGMQIEGEHVHVYYQLPTCPDSEARQDVEFSLSMLICTLRAYLGAHWLPQEIHFRHALDTSARAGLQHLLGGEVQLRDLAAGNSIVFPSHLLNHVCMQSRHDENVLIFFRKYVHDLCSDHTYHNTHDKVRHLLEQHLGGQCIAGQPPSLEWAASRLHLSPRSLQRKLALEQMTFSAILEQVRQNLALEWMRRPDASIGDLAEHLGYADNATFCNAFKRWSGVSPSCYRRRLIPQPAQFPLGRQLS